MFSCTSVPPRSPSAGRLSPTALGGRLDAKALRSRTTLTAGANRAASVLELRAPELIYVCACAKPLPRTRAVSSGFEAFSESFTRRRELGGACCADWPCEKVADLWGGTGEPCMVDPKGWTKFGRFSDGAAGGSGGGPKAAIHSGLDSALGSHPCVALSSYQASLVYGSFSNLKSGIHPFWKTTALNPGGLGGQSPPSWRRSFPD